MSKCYYIDEDDDIRPREKCLDCKWSYCEDIWGELMCKLPGDECNFQKEDDNGR